MSPLAPLRRPRALVPGDRVAVVAPAGPVPKDLLDAGVAILESWGLQVTLARHVLDRHPRFDYLAGTDAERAHDFTQAWLAPDIAGVLCARGGYGVTRMLDLVDWPALHAVEPKILAGYSDITALHEAVATQLGVAGLHAPMVATTAFCEDPATQEGLRRALVAPEQPTTIGSPQARSLVGGRAHGVTVGGCLSLLPATRGLPTAQTNIAGGILVLEDVDEECYRLDRYLTQLRQAGWLDGVAGIAIGSWTNCLPDPETLAELVLDRLGDLGVPVATELGFGHGGRTQTVPLGTPATLDASTSKPTLTVTEAVGYPARAQ